MGKFFLENYCIDHYFIGGLPIEAASELGYLSIKVSLLVLLFSIYFCSIGIYYNIFVSTLCNTPSTLQLVSEHFPLQKLWETFFKVETCIIGVFKDQRYIVWEVNLWLEKTT
jgi:hypothetical protein